MTEQRPIFLGADERAKKLKFTELSDTPNFPPTSFAIEESYDGGRLFLRQTDGKDDRGVWCSRQETRILYERLRALYESPAEEESA